MRDKNGENDGFMLDGALCFAIYNASKAMNQLYRTYLVEHDLTYPQMLVLAALWSKDGRSVGELGRLLKLDSGTLTPLLKRLEQRKMIVRKRSDEDERRVEILLAPAGKRLPEKLACLPADLLTDLDMSPKQVKELAGRIDAVTAQIETVLATTEVDLKAARSSS